MKYVIKFFNSCLYGKVSNIAVMFNCNKNDLFTPPPTPNPTPQNLCAAASLLLVGCHNEKQF